GDAWRLGGSARGRPPRRARGEDRPGGAAAATAHHLRAGEKDGAGDGQGRSGAHRRDGEVLPREADRVPHSVKIEVDAITGPAHDGVPVYGSGGFCSYSLDRLQEQLGDWATAGIPRVKMKIGREPERDPARLDAAREAVGQDVELFVDANGAFSRKQALAWAERYALEWGVTWFEEPVSSADAEGLRLIRDHAPAPLEIAAGEYAYVPADFRHLVGAVDCLQADVTRCGGITGLLGVAGLCDAFQLDL